MTTDPVISSVASLFSAALLGYSAIHKATDLRQFVATVKSHDLFGPMALPVALAVMAVEGLGALLCLDFGTGLRQVGAAIAVALLVAYALLLAAHLARGRTAIDCGCIAFGGHRAQLTGMLPARNLVAAAISASALLPVTERAMGLADGLVIFAGTMAIVLLYIGFDIVLGLAGREAAR